MIPYNLMRNSMKADYVETGAWSKKAIAEAKKVGTVNVVADSEPDNFTYIPELDPAKFDPEADYFYITTNNTIYGTRYTTLPTPPAGVPLVADASSNILSEVMDVNKFGLLYFGVQKNVGPAGLSIAIIREDLVGHCPKSAPSYFDYAAHVKNDSMLNTPPCYTIYMSGLVFKWMLENGGVEAMQKQNEYKAGLLYDCIDNSSFYTGTVVNKKDRSMMNVPFTLPNEELTAKFVKEAAAAGMVNLKGHRSVGGARASIYNAMPVEGVKKLVAFMKKFEMENK